MRRTILVILAVYFGASCSFSHGSNAPVVFLLDALFPPMYQLSGSVSGLVGNGLVLRNSNNDTVTVPVSSGTFTFPQKLHTDDQYEVTVDTYPAPPQSQLCGLSSSNARGTIGNGDVSGILVNCSNAAAIQVNVPAGNLQGAGLVLLNNLADPLTINGPVGTNSDFAFHTPITLGTPNYSVTIQTQPTSPWQTCNIANPSGAVVATPGVVSNPATGGNPLGPQISCTTNTYAIQVNVTGLVTTPALTGTLTIADSVSTASISPTANGAAALVTIASGAAYNVTVTSNPTGQSCSVVNGTGTMGGGPITLNVNCSPQSYSISGTITSNFGSSSQAGPRGSGFQLQVAGSVTQTISISPGTGSYSFIVPHGTNYTVSVASPSAGPTAYEDCVVASPSGTIDHANATGVDVTCTPKQYSVSGTISGFTGGTSMGLTLSDGDNHTYTCTANQGDTALCFLPTDLIDSGSGYSVSITTPPTGGFYCAITGGGTGTVTNGNINVVITCGPAQIVNVNVNDFATGYAYSIKLTDTSISNFNTTNVTTNGALALGPAIPTAHNFTALINQPTGQRCFFNTSAGFTLSTTNTANDTASGTMGVTTMNISVNCTPLLVSSTPADAATNTGIGAVTLVFNKAVQATSVSANASRGGCTGSVQISSNSHSSCVPFTVSPTSGNSTTFTLTPVSPNLLYDTQYVMKLGTGIMDAAGNNMSTAYTQPTGFNTGGLAFRWDRTSGNDTDMSTAARSATPSGSPGLVTGKDGESSGARSFVAADQLKYSDAGLPAGATPRTLCAWIAPSTYDVVAGWSIPVSYGDTASNSQGQFLGTYLTGSAVNASYSGWNTGDFWTGANVPLNSWTHLCGTFDGSTASIYMNGAYVGGTNSFSPSWNTVLGSGLTIGLTTNASAFGFIGKLDDVRIYSAVLSQYQLRQLAAQVPNGLVARYDFADGNITDSSGYDNDLTNSGATAVVDRFGLISALRFNGTSDFASVTNPALPTTGSRTMCAWYNAASNPSSGLQYSVATQGAGGSSGLGHLMALRNNSGTLNLVSGFWNSDPTLSPYTLYGTGIGTWQFLCGTHSTTENRLYLNGSVVSSGASNTLNLNSSLLIGMAATAPSYFDGSISDVRIYKRALTQTEILAIMQQPSKFINANGGHTGSFGGVSNGDTICGAGYKAMIAGSGIMSGTRQACSSGNCATSGILEHIDWVLRPQITYVTAGYAPVFTADSNGIVTTGVSNAIGAGSTWTGLSGSWTTVGSCTSGTFGNWNFSLAAGTLGDAGAVNSTLWSNGTTACSSSLNIYCVQQ